VASATLLLQNYHRLTRVDTGFDASNTWAFRVAARWDENRARVGTMQEQLLTALQALPHVRMAGMTNFLPATGATLRYQVKVEGLTGSNDDGSITTGARMIGGAYLQAIGVRLVAGSWCPAGVAPLREDLGAASQSMPPLFAMVNRRFVDLHARGQDLVGRTLHILGRFPTPYTIAGVSGDIVEDGQRTEATPYVYTCEPLGAWPDPEYVVRTVDRRAPETDIRRIVREIDPGRAVFGLRPLEDVLDQSLQRPRLDAAMLLFFAAAAVMLAAIGQYSLFMLVASERAREMAVRLAVGGNPGHVFGLVMAGAGRLLAAGLFIGLALTAGATRMLRGVLFGVGPADPTAVAAAVLTLAIVSTAAVAVPALWAARVSPSTLLRGE
jgi:putative ABC transport system permease protein